MMKRFFYILSLGLVLTALSQSCAKEAEVSSDPVPEAGNKLITITVGAPEDLQTRVSFSTDPSDEDMLSVRWQANDKIVINGNTFTIDTMNEEGTLATFIGENPGAGPYTIFYAGNGAEAKTLAEVESQDYSSQTQSANGATSHLWFAAKLSGVNSYNNIAFSSTWAEAHGGSYKQSGALRLRIQKPEGITSVKSVTLTAPSAAFYRDNTLDKKTESVTVNFSGAVDVSGDTHIIVYAMLPWGDVTIPGGDYKYSVMASDYDLYVKTNTLSAANLASSSVNVFKVNKSGFATQRYAGGTGAEADPWLIAHASHMVHMGQDGVADEVKYFKMIADVDMRSVAAADWTPYNYVSSYKKGIDFDGDNHTVSNLTMVGRSGTNYMSVFGILNGTVQNVTFDHCSISSDKSSPLGLVAGWAGTNGASITSTWNNVHAVNCSVTAAYESNNVGGLAGSADGSTFTNCSFDGTVSRTAAQTDASKYYYVGGLVGGIPSGSLTPRVSFTGCSTSGSVSATTNAVGGILGGTNNTAATTLTGCSSTMDISSSGKVIGGIVGYVGGVTVSNCSYDGTITSTLAGSCYAAGLVSYCYHFVNITGSTSAGAIIADDSSSIIGGIAGSLNPQSGDTDDLIISGCTSSMTISGGSRIGGILGITNSDNYGGDRRISGCTYSGELTSKGVITSNKVDYAYSGGIVGYGKYVGIENCAVTNKVKTTSTGTDVGGIAGYLHTANLEGCLVSGTVETNGGNYKGGLVGVLASVDESESTVNTIKKSAFTGVFSSATGNQCAGIVGRVEKFSVIEDCHVSGTYTGNGQRQGGIAGSVEKGDIAIRRCYVNVETLLNQNFNIGGIVGMAQAANTTEGTHANLNVTVDKCIAWCSAITAQTGSTTQWSSGAIIGSTGGQNTLTDCYRKPDMTLTYTRANTSWPYLYDQENASTSSQLTYYNGAAEAAGTAQSPYHGKSAGKAWTDAGQSAPATITLSALAQQIGWSSEVWNFEGDNPALKTLPSVE